jgi:hypothetical protein
MGPRLSQGDEKSVEKGNGLKSLRENQKRKPQISLICTSTHEINAALSP